MVSFALAPFLDTDMVLPDGVIATAVLSGGCQFSCPFCIVRSRNERRTEAKLSPKDYSDFLAKLARNGRLAAAAVVGDEPLQEHVWPSVYEFLRSAQENDATTGLITNGYELHEFIPRLTELRPDRILVSLDAIGSRHDTIRRKEGGFRHISLGLKSALNVNELERSISIASIIMPRNQDDIVNVIKFAGDLGIAQVVISPLLQTTKSRILKVHPCVREEGWKHIESLLVVGRNSGVKLVFSDEFGLLGGEWLRLISDGCIKRPTGNPNLIRIDPNGGIRSYEQIRKGLPKGDLMMLGDNKFDELFEHLRNSFRQK